MHCKRNSIDFSFFILVKQDMIQEKKETGRFNA